MSRGRPSPYRPDFAEQARKLCRNGATDRGIADILGVCVRTFYRWRAAHDDVAEALRAGKELADDRVQRALYERACGYDYDDTKIFHPSGAKEPVIVPIRVHVQADVGAARQWLASRRPKRWGSVKESPENFSLAEALEKTQARAEKHRREKKAEEAIPFAERVETRVAEELGRRGLQA